MIVLERLRAKTAARKKLTYRKSRGSEIAENIPLVNKLSRVPERARKQLIDAMGQVRGGDQKVLGYANVAVHEKLMPSLKRMGFEPTRIATPLPGEKPFTTTWRSGRLHAHKQGPFFLVHQDKVVPKGFGPSAIKHGLAEGIPSLIKRLGETQPLVKAGDSPRQVVLDRLREKTAAALPPTEDQPTLYAPEVYGHELGHHEYRKRLGNLAPAIATAGSLARAGGRGVRMAGVLDRNPVLQAGGSLLSIAGETPRIVEETAASRSALRKLKDQLSPEDYQTAKKRLVAAGSTYYIRPVLQTLAGGASLAGALSDSPEVKAVGAGLQLAALPLGWAGKTVAGKMIKAPGGKRMTKDEIRQLHEKAAPDIGLSLGDRPTKGYAFYMKAPKGKIGKLVGKAIVGRKDLGMDEATKRDFLERGGIHLGRI
jgi:hypothetical protein